MTQNEFNLLCNDELIDPSIALENDEIISALKDRDDAQVILLLTTQF
jgi:serine/threonine protein phosphatase PrpC